MGEAKRRRERGEVPGGSSERSKPGRPELRHVRTWVHLDHEWTEEDIDTCAWLLTHTTATITCDLSHPDFARALYRHNRMRGTSRERTLAGMADEFPAGVVAYVMDRER